MRRARLKTDLLQRLQQDKSRPIPFGTQNATVENLSPAADAGRVIDFFIRVDF